MKIGTYLSDPISVHPSGVGVPSVPTATAADFGAGMGAATEKVGNSLIQAGIIGGAISRQMRADEKEERNKQVAAETASAVGKFDFTADYISLQTKAGDRPQDFGETVGRAYDDKLDKYVDAIGDNDVRRLTRQHLAVRREMFVGQANAFEHRSQVDASARDANDGINTQVNRVRADGSLATFDDAAQSIDRIIDTRQNVPGDIKEKMRVDAKHQLARRRFEGMIASALLDPVALEGIKNELTDPKSPWQGKIKPEDYDRLLDQIDTANRAANSQEVALARTALQSAMQRHHDGQLLTQDERNAIKATVVKSGRAELMSQYAMFERGQQVYQELQGLPLDQMRAKIEEMRKRGGITALPAPVQQGITEGAALTNGRIGSEFLAGLVNAEYTQDALTRGDYGQPTGARLPDGRRASDAIGIAQFTGPTWRETLRAHADTLGIDAKADDATLDAMRKDPVLSLKAAALHALDNKTKLEGTLGRPITDGDLYFAHFLGTAGAIRFLRAADAAPNAPATASVDKDQVEANKNVFFNEAGKARSNNEVRVFMTDRMMNGPSRVDYAGVKAGELVLRKTVEALRDDPITFAATVGRFGPVGDMQSAEGIARRGVVAAQIAETYGIPAASFKPLTKSEVETLGTKARDGTAEETLQVMGSIAGLGNPEIIKAANRQIGEKDQLYGYAAGMIAARPEMKNVAADIIRGEKRLKTDKDVKLQLGMTDNDISTTFDQIVGKAVIGTAQGSQIRQAAMAYYAERMLSRGDAEPGRFNKERFTEAIHAVLGGDGNPGKLAIGNINGQPMLLPQGMNEGMFNTALRRMTIDDYTAASKFGGPPRYGDGKVIDPAEIARAGRFEALGNGEYRIKMGDDKYALSAAYKDGSADFYIFRADPRALTAAAQRQPQIAPLPPVVPGVKPAQPRVIQ